MNFKNLLIVSIITFLVTISTVYAEIDLSMELRDSDKKLINLESVVSPNISLVLYVRVINPSRNWVLLEDMDFQIDCKRYEEKVQCIKIPQPITSMIPPEDDDQVFPIILDGYNELEQIEKLGSWHIELKSYTKHNTKCFSGVLKKSSTCTIKEAGANPIDFKVEKETAKVEGEKIDLGKVLRDRSDTIYKVILAIAAIATIYGVYRRWLR